MLVVFLHQNFFLFHVLSEEALCVGQGVFQLTDLNRCDIFEQFLVLGWESVMLVIKLNSYRLGESGGVTTERMHVVRGLPCLLIVLIDVLRKGD